MRKQIAQWLEVKAADPQIARRGRLLNIVLLGYVVLTLFLVAIVLFFWWQERENFQSYRILIIIAIFLLVCIVIYFLNRRISPRWAAGLFVFINLLLASLADTPEALAQKHSMIAFTVPIVIASMFLHPLAGFAAAGFAFGIVTHFNVMLGEVPGYPSMLVFFIIALISWLTTDNLERALQEMRTLNLELDQRVAERTQALQEANTALQTRNEELDAFAHSAAHDIKTPLTAIYGFSRLLARRYRDLPETELQQRLENIAQNSKRVCNIVDELLLLSTVRQMDEITLAPLDMRANVTTAQERLADLIVEYEADIVLPATWPAAYGYAPWIEEVWVNYLSNALKYGGRPPQIVVGASETADAQVCFWVQDNGAGLTVDECARLFTPFTRLGQVQTKGHGLGLSIVRRIIERLNGEVSVESTPGAGSRFSFTLPQAPVSH